MVCNLRQLTVKNQILGLHYEFDHKLPGGISQPRFIDVINEKLDLINRFLDLGERVGSQEERDTLKELRKLELEVIKEIILNVEKKTEPEEENKTYTEGYLNTLTDLQKQMEDLFKSFSFNQKATN